MKALFDLLNEFKWYRKYKGGKWHLIERPSENTPDEVITFWTQTPEENANVKRSENYYTRKLFSKNPFLRLFKEFKFARKRIGGTWYYVELFDSGGFASPIKYWTQTYPDREDEVLDTEKY